MSLGYIYVVAMTEEVTMHDRATFCAAVADLGNDRAVAVAFTDLDDFTGLNDRFGRAGGDAALRTYQRTLTGSLPKDARICRLGGDEFAIALPDASAESALILLEEVRAHLASHP